LLSTISSRNTNVGQDSMSTSSQIPARSLRTVFRPARVPTRWGHTTATRRWILMSMMSRMEAYMLAQQR
ncbi:hypothetical protein GN956_G20702, partial [Arapaima gigas]